MFSLDELIVHLSQRLKDPLPGSRAYERVRARHQNGGNISFPEQSSPREGAVLIAFYEKDGHVHFPLIQRPDYDGVHSGQIALPGGKKERLDKSLIQTAIRESEEEVGIDGNKLEIIGSLSSFYVGASNFQVLPVVGYLKEKPLFVPEPGEVAEVIESPLSDFLLPNAIKEKPLNVRGFPLIAPYFDVKQKVIWGATAAMLSELMMIIEEI